MTGTLAIVGAVGGGVAGHAVAPDGPGVVASLALGGLGLGGAFGVLLGGGWRSRRPAAEVPPEPVAVAAPEPEPEPEPPPPPPPPPPENEEPGWYTWADGSRRFWDGEAWTEHVW